MCVCVRVTNHSVLDTVSYPTSHILKYISGFSLGFRETLAPFSHTRKKNPKTILARNRLVWQYARLRAFSTFGPEPVFFVY